MAGLLDVIRKILGSLADAQTKHPFFMIAIIVAFSIFSFIGATQITFQSDLSELDPQDIPVTQLRNKIQTDFNEFESVVILIEIDPDIESDITDIRDPRVMRMLIDLDQELREEPTIQAVQSVGQAFFLGVPETLEDTKTFLNFIPGSDEAFNRAYTWTTIFIEADVGGDNVKIQALDDRINEILAATSKPGGIKITTTGDAPLGSAIFRLMLSDAFFTLIFSTVVIFILVSILEFSPRKGFIILFPLLFGILWTVGTMGWLGIPITIATAAMGAMLLGLGVEYSIFLYSRFKEERETKSRDKSLKEALVNVGSTLVSSGTTTLIGFFSLALSAFPVLSDLGLTLGLGIAFMFIATIFAAPVVIALDEMIEIKLKGEKELKHEIEFEKKTHKKSRLTKIYNVYGKFLSQKPVTILFIAIGITALMIYGISQIINQDVDFETILPEDLEEIVAFITITDEKGDDSSALILVEVNPNFVSSDEPRDIRDPRVLNYIDALTQKSLRVEDTLSVSSITEIVKEENDGFIPNTIATQREIFDSQAATRFVKKDYSSSLIRISLTEDGDATEVVRQIKEIIEFSTKPAGVTARASGTLVVEQELDALNQPDSQRTSLIAFAGIIVFLYLITRSIKFTILPLITVVLGIIWTLGLTGLFRVPFNNITSSVITMTIGIGIDFGLQVINRFNQELETHDKRKAMEITMTSILTPMIITVIAALIGFRAMSLGQLRIMGDLGTLMSFGVAGSMLAAVTGVASIVLLVQRDKKKK